MNVQYGRLTGESVLLRMSNRAQLEEMIARTAMGSRADFQNLYKATSAKLFGVCLRILHNQSEAEEALQETYMKIWRSADRYAIGNASPISWLAAIARNTAIDLYRRKKPESADISEAETVADSSPSPESRAILSAEVERLTHCMLELKTEHASALQLHAVQ